jgi:hypothetical protein
MFGIPLVQFIVIYLVVQLILFILCYKYWRKVETFTAACISILCIGAVVYYWVKDIYDCVQGGPFSFWTYWNDIFYGLLTGAIIILGPFIATVIKSKFFKD